MSQLPILDDENRKFCDAVGEILKELSSWDHAGPDSEVAIDHTSVQLRKLLLDADGGNYEHAWKLLGLQGQPTIPTSDLDSIIEGSSLQPQSLIWVEAPVAEPKPSGWEVVTDSTKFIPKGIKDPKLIPGKRGSLVFYEVVTGQGAIYFWGYQPLTGTVIATKYEPPYALMKWAEIIKRQADFRSRTAKLGQIVSRNFTVSELRRSTAIATSDERLTRNNAIGFLANRRGAHIDPAEKRILTKPRERRRESQYSGLRNIPSWVNGLQAVFLQVRSIGLAIAKSPDTATYLNRWSALPPRGKHTNP